MHRLNDLSRRAWCLLVAGALVGLAGCGGGDGGGAGNNRVLTGQVKDAAGRPLAGVTLKAGGKTVVTNANGQYSLAGLPNTGNIVITASKPGFQTATVTITNPAQGNVPITLVPIGSTTNGKLTGIVKDSLTGVALQGVTVAIGGVSGLTNAQGAYSLVGIPSTGTWTVTASKTGYTTQTLSVPASTAGSQNINLVPTNSGPPAPPVFP